MDNFDIYFSGKLMPGADKQKARAELGRRFKLEGNALKHLFSGTAVKIKSGVDVEAANRYRAAFRDAGAMIDIVPHGAALQPAKPRPTATQASAPVSPVEGESGEPGLTLLPPRTGSLADCAPEVEATDIPDTDWIEVAAPGATLDLSPPTPPPEVDTSGISLAPAGSGSLEDCAFTRPPRPIPDISHMALVEPGDDDKKD